MEKIRKIVFMLIFILALPNMALAESVYTDSTLDVFAVDENTVTVYADMANADGETVTASSDIVVYSSSVVYDEGTISSTYLDIAKGLLKYVPFGEDYVFARTGQYEYLFAVGDFENGFYGTAEVWRLTVGGYNSSYSFDNYTDTAFSLSVNDGLVYSSISPYPSLEGVDYSYALLFVSAFALCLFGVWTIIRYLPTFLR